MAKKNKPNQLIDSKSPYLLQHAYNPVNWYQWGDEAFAIAKKENKPVFLSIGYSTCHWCHVMAHESFEDEEVAALMNEAFVNIKVDREERPDIDSIYMSVCQMLTGGGGWPLTIVMTPDKKPFFATTYVPKENNFGRFGMMEMIPQLVKAWKERPDEILKSAEEITKKLTVSAASGPRQQISKQVFESAYESLVRIFDKDFGGFGTKPKFPMAHNITFLLRYAAKNPESNALEMLNKTLDMISKGGIRDHLGNGFHRYSTDSKWLIPHFEKMLYDQALLIPAYAEAWQLKPNPVFKDAAESTIEYVLRDMLSPEGAFFSAEDADSEGVEGKFYVWEYDEIKSVLADRTELFTDAYGVLEAGNFIEDHNSEPDGTNILYKAASDSDLADKHKISEQEVISRLKEARKLLFDHREKRIRPGLDDKILCDWNGLMILALAKSGKIFNKKEYITAARKASDFIFEKMTDSKGRLLHTYRKGKADIPGNIDDYAFLIAALIDLYEADFDILHIDRARKLNDILDKHFLDNSDGAYFFTADYAEKLIVRKKELYDGALPSGTSLELMNMIRLERLSGDQRMKKKVKNLIESYGSSVNSSPIAYTQFLNALDFWFGPSMEIVICAYDFDKTAKDMLELINSKFIPNKTIMLKTNENSAKIEKLAPFTVGMKVVKGETAAYVCTNNTCAAPVYDIAALKKLI
ncbi:MAG: thioredoxin domain-containing protein [Candidatus Kapabacteria bacterium]|jgi:uncharacterized protein YyaL (SSP411 family)|nr:thioredoxin domain-containing protein [Candidatus Kapabacteria bacterium]